MKDSLRRNASLLIISQALSTGAGFLFWLINARLFQASQIGLATALISFAGLVATFTNLGLANTIIRFLPTSKRRSGLVTGSILVIASLSVLGGLIASVSVKTFIPRLSLIQSSAFLSCALLMLIVGMNLSSFLDNVLLAFRKSSYILTKAAIVNILRLVLPFFMITLALNGIIATYVIVFTAGIVFSSVVVWKLLPKESRKPNLSELIQHHDYMISNYFGGMLGVLPGALIPIIVLGKLGAASAAYFYMPMQIAAFLGILSSSVSQSFMSESAQADNLTAHRAHFRNALVHLYRLLIPAALILSIAGWPILRIYGATYAAQGFVPLIILASASLFIGINWLGDTWLNIQKQSRAYFYMNALNALCVVGSVYVFAQHGLTATAIGWLVGQVISASVYLVIFARAQLLIGDSSSSTA
jgi:O-antigen/teichoic acid export membrane protein